MSAFFEQIRMCLIPCLTKEKVCLPLRNNVVIGTPCLTDQISSFKICWCRTESFFVLICGQNLNECVAKSSTSIQNRMAHPHEWLKNKLDDPPLTKGLKLMTPRSAPAHHSPPPAIRFEQCLYCFHVNLRNNC